MARDTEWQGWVQAPNLDLDTARCSAIVCNMNTQPATPTEPATELLNHSPLEEIHGPQRQKGAPSLNDTSVSTEQSAASESHAEARVTPQSEVQMLDTPFTPGSGISVLSLAYGSAVSGHIERDKSRFDGVVKGKVRENLKKYLNNGEMIGRKGKDLVSIPIPSIDPPRFRFGSNGRGGAGQGDGEVGDPLGQGQTQPGDQPGEAGSDEGQHVLEVDVNLEQLAEFLGKELELPRIEHKGKDQIVDEKFQAHGVRRIGPEGLKIFRRSFIEGLKREIASGEYNPQDPVVVLHKEDKRYRGWEPVPQPHASAVILYVMDVSGSMTEDQKAIVRTESFWIDTWLRSQYKGLERRYIIHDAAAKVVDEDTFYHTRESGGTRISAAYRVTADTIKKEFNPADWNIYVFQFSDGDNWGDDNKIALKILKEELLPVCNLFGYGQVESPYGSGEFMRTLQSELGKDVENLELSEIHGREGIKDSIRAFLGKGK